MPSVSKPTSDAAVQKATGKTWEQWYRILDQAHASRMDHTQIATHLRQKQGVSGWWAQSITVGYERARGMRQLYEKKDGFSATSSKTITAGLKQLQGTLTEKERSIWLGQPIQVSTLNSKGLSGKWEDGTRIVIGIYPKDKHKSLIAVEHSKLKNQQEVIKMKQYWKEALQKLANHLEAQNGS